MTTEQMLDFEIWWTEHGQFCRAGGGDYEKTFAFRAWQAASASFALQKIAEFGEEQAAQPVAVRGWKLLKDTTQSERSWTEDSAHENGNYHCLCCHCGRTFIGHKRRAICKVCAISQQSEIGGNNGSESRTGQSSEGSAQAERSDTGAISSAVRAGADQHLQHRAGQPDTDGTHHQGDSGGDGIYGVRDVQTEEVGLQPPPPPQGDAGKLVPLTDQEIDDVIPEGVLDCLADPYDKDGSGDNYSSIPHDIRRIFRAAEKHYGIGPEQEGGK